jgi:hypothetical protein
MRTRIIITITALILGLSDAIYAATLFTPPLHLTLVATAEFRCQIVNVSNKNRTVRIQIVRASDGDVFLDSGDLILNPGRGDSISFSPGVDGFVDLYCKFQVMGSKNSVRASACVEYNDLGCSGGAVSAE